MPLRPGTTLGHYDVTALIGEGGMGQVYQATDTKLNRQVALKILPEAFAADPDRLARFQREAQVLASLNHPNIAAIYGLEEADDTRALVLELVEGPTLADRIAQGPIPVDEALPIATQIAEALEAAHEAGVIHRDLKPANIKVKDDDTVKVLDFGLAKALDTTPEGDPSQSPTLTAAATQMGVIMGTAAYMSPEQARGSTADHRADIWAFGAVLYEMLTGERLFSGTTVSDTLASVLKTEPDWHALASDIPVSVRKLLRRCLDKDRRNRLHHIGDGRVEINEALTPSSRDAVETSPATQPGGWQRALPWVAGLVIGGLIAGGVVWSLTRPSAPRLARFPLGVGLSQTSLGLRMVVSPDGTRIVYVSEGDQLYVRQIDQLEAVPLRGAVGINPFFSPNGTSVGFRGPGFTITDDNLYRASIDGGPLVTLSEGIRGIHGASWGPNDTIVLASAAPGPLFRMAAAGGERHPLTELADGEMAHRWPEFLPGGEAVLFTVVKGAPLSRRIDPESMETWVLDLTSNQRTLLISGGGNPHYVPTGHIVYGVDGTLRAVPFDLDRLEVTGDPVSVLAGVFTERNGAAHFSVGQDGSLVYVTGEAGDVRRSLVWVDREGRETAIAAEPRPYSSVQLSPDERQAVLQVGPWNGGDLWVYNLARDSPNQLTFDSAMRNRYPIWTPDGEQVVFASARDGGVNNLWSTAADGTGQGERLSSAGAFGQAGYSWSADGQALVIMELRADAERAYIDIGVLSMVGERTIEWLLESDSNEASPDVSPDGRWMAYTTDESGQYEVFVTPFPNVGDGRWKISQAGGFAPQWGPDSRDLFFQTSQGTIMVATNGTEPTFSPGTPAPLFSGPYLIGTPPAPPSSTFRPTASGS